MIAKIAPTFDPRHIEGFMRLDHPTLDHLSPDDFAAEVALAALCVNECGTERAELLARSFGL
jgi:hypothetical protein